jgi:hypothetical protein
MKISLEDLKLDKINVIFPGNLSFKLSDKIEAIGLEFLQNLKIILSKSSQKILLPLEAISRLFIE